METLINCTKRCHITKESGISFGGSERNCFVTEEIQEPKVKYFHDGH